MRQEYNDNIFLENRDDERDVDWITTISPGFEAKPELKRHKFTQYYRSDIGIFYNHEDENSVNHIAKTDLELNYPDYKINFTNNFRYLTDPIGIEETNRIPVVTDKADFSITRLMNKLDAKIRHGYYFLEYRSDAAIGSFFGQPLTYGDLDRDERDYELETAWKLWPKTRLLLSGVYGEIDHDSGRKSDSDYYMILTGLRGQPTAKMTVEGKIGYRRQDYFDIDEEFSSVVFYATLIEDFTNRDVLRLDFTRTPYETNYANNVYYEGSSFSLSYKHGFTERLFGTLEGYYQLNEYPTETTEGIQTDKRRDNYWSASSILSYEMPNGFILSLQYQFRQRKSNFADFNYNNNRAIFTFLATF